MRRLLIWFAIVGVLVLMTAGASAHVPSNQYGAFELKFGPYTPNVDDQPGLNGTPYRDTFGDDDMMFLTLIELDYQFWRFLGGSFGIGGAFGFMQAYAKASGIDSGAESSEYNVLNVIPFSLLAVFRFDLLADKAHIPLVPYIKGGPCWYLWWMETAGETGDSKGGTLGVQFITGLMFRLDPLDRMSARTFDNEMGVNHSYLFFELMWANVEGVSDDNLHLSPTNLSKLGPATFMIGLALEF